jgi:selenocysteine lyase/cysteine desulfurase
MTVSSYSPVRPTPKSDFWVVTNFNPLIGFPMELRWHRTSPMIYETLEQAWEAADEANSLQRLAINATADPEADLTEALQHALTLTVSQVNEQTLRGLIHYITQKASYLSIITVISELSEENRQNLLALLLKRADTKTIADTLHELNQNNIRKNNHD